MTTYKVKRNGKFLKSFPMFFDYEAARSFVRKYIRANRKELQDQMDGRAGFKNSHPYWTKTAGEFGHRNPALSSYEYKIVKV